MVNCLGQGSPNFSARSPQNNSARGWGSPLTLEVAYNFVHSHANALLGLHEHQYNTTEQLSGLLLQIGSSMYSS